MNSRILFVAVVAIVVAAGSPGVARASISSDAGYGWPVKPFHRQHPVRGFFGDPRIGMGDDGRPSTQLHFGIDISAPDGTAVYAMRSGRISIDARHGDVVHVVSGVTDFSYWHLVPAVHSGQAVAYRTLLGHVATGWEHVHFSEAIAGVYANPLRVGALQPYRDQTRPTIHAFGIERDGVGLGRVGVHGTFDLVVECSDTTPMAVPGKWADKPVVPARIEWRIGGRGQRGRWRTAVDFRDRLPALSFEAVYARWTRQNHPWRRGGRGRYRFLLAHAWESTSLPDGRYRLEVRATDTRGNRAEASTTFTIANGPAPTDARP